MRTTCLLAVLAIAGYGQVVKPTAGALTPSNLAPATSAAPVPVAAAPTAGSIPKALTSRDTFKRLESDFDYQLKTSDPTSPMDVLGYTRGLYLQGFGVVFTTEVDLAQSNILPMFHGNITADEKAKTRERKLKHLDLLQKQMRTMMATCGKGLESMGPNDQIVVAVRLIYQGWEDRTGLPDQIVMRADKRTAQSGDAKAIKVDIQ